MSNTKIAILRGINVGGKRKILMSDLRSMCEDVGLKKVKTYIQSGNLIFTSERQNSDLEAVLEQSIQKTFGFEVPVIARTAGDVLSLQNNNPFLAEGTDISQLHLTFLKKKPSAEDRYKIQATSLDKDKFKIDGKEIFIFCSGKYHQSKLTNNFFEKKLKSAATTRNWKTVLKLIELSKE